MLMRWLALKQSNTIEKYSYNESIDTQYLLREQTKLKSRNPKQILLSLLFGKVPGIDTLLRLLDIIVLCQLIIFVESQCFVVPVHFSKLFDMNTLPPKLFETKYST